MAIGQKLKGVFAVALALPLLALAEAALDPVAYLDWDEATGTFVTKECLSYTVVTAEMGELANGWFVVRGDISRGQLKIKGNVSLILTDGLKRFRGVPMSSSGRMI